MAVAAELIYKRNELVGRRGFALAGVAAGRQPAPPAQPQPVLQRTRKTQPSSPSTTPAATHHHPGGPSTALPRSTAPPATAQTAAPTTAMMSARPLAATTTETTETARPVGTTTAAHPAMTTAAPLATRMIVIATAAPPAPLVAITPAATIDTATAPVSTSAVAMTTTVAPPPDASSRSPLTPRTKASYPPHRQATRSTATASGSMSKMMNYTRISINVGKLTICMSCATPFPSTHASNLLQRVTGLRLRDLRQD